MTEIQQRMLRTACDTALWWALGVPIIVAAPISAAIEMARHLGSNYTLVRKV